MTMSSIPPIRRDDHPVTLLDIADAHGLPWRCGWCRGEYRGKPTNTRPCQEPGCTLELCPFCQVRCALCAEVRCFEHVVMYEGRQHCAECRDQLRDEAEQERAVATIHVAPPDEQNLIAFAWAVNRALGGA